MPADEANQPNIEIIELSDEPEEPWMTIEQVRGELHLKAAQTNDVLKQAEIQGKQIPGQGNRKFYSSKAIKQLAFNRGAHTAMPARDAKELKMMTYGGTLEDRITEFKTDLQTKDDTIAQLNQDIGAVKAEKGDIKTLKKQLSKTRKQIRVQNTELMQFRTMEVAKRLIRNNEKWFIGFGIFVAFLLWLFTAPILTRLLQPFFAFLSGI